MGRIVIIAGGRDQVLTPQRRKILDAYEDAHPIHMVLHGDAAGIDRMAAAWATRRDIDVMPFEAEWTTHGKQAGNLRNQRMAEYAALYGDPAVLIAFPGGTGTMDMVHRARVNGIEVIEPESSKTVKDFTPAPS